MVRVWRPSSCRVCGSSSAYNCQPRAFNSYRDYFSQYSSSIIGRLIYRPESQLARQPTPAQLSIQFIGFQFGNESIINWLIYPLFTPQCLHLNTCHLYLLYSYTSSRQLPSASPNLLSQNLLSALLSSLVV